MSDLIQVKNLCKTYGEGESATKAVCGANFSIQKGEFVAIMGPSGSGKSTLMQMLGFLDRPSEGEYFFEGKDILHFSDDELAKIRNEKVGFIFQSFNLLPRTTVSENVELPLLYDEKRLSQEENEKKVLEALKSVSMEHRAEYSPNQLSGGEKQRVSIARALINNPAIIFADEPTGNLDSKSGIQVMEILDDLNEEGHTIILVTHETQTAQYAKRIISMKDGQIISDVNVENRIKLKDGDTLK
ncbi:MAG: macrolide ABC transporter ATP-binding protein [Candidatus Moranbacteria bacterium CG10_big_fil_rev_8_21_14_0_10_35_21]|nr:MAG: macrolide ABC transporter ATP-binding protein [Candidatus Moranbacteria bacterium CG10_big_fil_rev_8_21_14_0_10_35_21]PJA88925.1 MAG: macrolide ABC transporter ATP-binding protein [Candidatus Moranbacteria bacterium CG_4_9_14_3_um_filter_36_9]